MRLIICNQYTSLTFFHAPLLAGFRQCLGSRPRYHAKLFCILAKNSMKRAHLATQTPTKKPGLIRAFLWAEIKSLIIGSIPASFITSALRLFITLVLLIFDDAHTHTESRTGLVRQSSGDVLSVVAIGHVVTLDDFAAGINLAAALHLFGARLVRVGDAVTNHRTGNTTHCGRGFVACTAADLAAQQRAGHTADDPAGCRTVAVRIGHAVADHRTGHRTGAGRSRVAAAAADLAAEQAAGDTADYRTAHRTFLRRDLP